MTSAPMHEPKPSPGAAPATLVDLSAIDLDATVATRDQLLELIPHRHEMALLDRVIWVSGDATSGVASLTTRGDEFWVRGHFPGRPMLPGVLMVEAGAQLACYLYNKRAGELQTAAFLRIDNCVFRRSVGVDEQLLILCKGVKHSPRRFISKIQGVMDNQICFEADISGMRLSDE